MRKLFIVLLVLSLAGISTAATLQLSGLALEWDYEGNTLDSSGNGNNGSLTGTANYVAGMYGGQAMSFNGSTKVENTSVSGLSHFSVLVGSYYRQGDWSMNYWVKQDAIMPDYEVEGAVGNYVSGQNVAAYECSRGGGMYLLRGHGAWYDLSAGSIGNDGQWHMVTVVNDDYDTVHSTWSVYIDGTLAGAKSEATGGKAMVVRNGWGSGRTDLNYFTGLMDAFQVYNRALVQADITQLYTYPEPATICLLGFGALALIRRKR